MSKFVEAFVHTITNIYHFDNEKEFHEFLKSEKAKEITDLLLSERMTRQEYYATKL